MSWRDLRGQRVLLLKSRPGHKPVASVRICEVVCCMAGKRTLPAAACFIQTKTSGTKVSSARTRT